MGLEHPLCHLPMWAERLVNISNNAIGVDKREILGSSALPPLSTKQHKITFRYCRCHYGNSPTDIARDRFVSSSCTIAASAHSHTSRVLI